MKAILLTNCKKMEQREIPEPELKPNGVIVRIEAAAICNTTDYKSYSAENPAEVWPCEPWPAVIGHEFCGRVSRTSQCGNISDLKIGSGGIDEARQVIPQLHYWLEEGKLNLKDMISKVISLEEIPQAIEDLQKRPKSLIKVVIKP